MSVKIKDKEKVQSINKMDRHQNLRHYKKQISFKDKRFVQDDNEQLQNNQTPHQKAVNNVIKSEKITASQTVYRGKKLYRSKVKQRQQNKVDHISEFNPKLQATGNNNLDNIKGKPLSKIKLSRKTKNINYLSSIVSRNHQSMMKSSYLKKYKQSFQGKSSSSSTIKSKVKHSAEAVKSAGNIVKKTVGGLHKLISLGTGMLIIIVIVLFIGIFAVLGDDSSTNTSLMPLNEEVIAYEETIRKYAKQYNIEDYVPLLQAVMMQESGGKGNDPMQSSECEYNKKYPKEPNGITEVEYSIDCGVHYFSDCLTLANVTGIADTENISLALQGYNFGKGYITWAIEHFDGYTRANAKVYSDQKKAELQTDVYGDPDYVSHVLQYYHLGNGDIVIIAKSQVGNVGGKPYWTWYGFDQRVEWCAIFVSWCANESGQLNITVPKFSRVEDGIQWYKNQGKWKDRNYVPKAGDLIFFDWENDNDPDHVGIVEKVEDGKVYTIEGNSSDKCKEKKYGLNYNEIYGYCAI